MIMRITAKQSHPIGWRSIQCLTLINLYTDPDPKRLKGFKPRIWGVLQEAPAIGLQLLDHDSNSFGCCAEKP